MYETQVATPLPITASGQATLEAYDRNATIWKTIHRGDDRKKAHRVLLEHRDSSGTPGDVVRVREVREVRDRETGNIRLVSKTEAIQQRLRHEDKKARRRRK